MPLDQTFAALADPTRRALLARLAQGPATVGELAAPLAISQPAVSRHLKVLEQARLITTRVDGTRRPRALAPEPLRAASDWLRDQAAAFEVNYARLDTLLATMMPPQPPGEDR